MASTHLVGDAGQSLTPRQIILQPAGTGNPTMTLEQVVSIADIHDFSGTNVALLGDSISTNGGIGLNGGSQFPPAGGWRTQSFSGYGNWLSALSGQRLNQEPQLNCSLSGRTSPQIAAFGLPLVIAQNPDFCIVEAGTNDPGNGVTYAQSVAAFTLIFQSLATAGIRTVVIPVTPRTLQTATAYLQYAQINRFIRQYAKAHGNIIIADPRLSAFMSSSSAPATNMTSDGLHPTPLGAYYWGTVLWNAISPFIQQTDLHPLWVDSEDLYDATNNVTGNMLTNGMFTTTTGGTVTQVDSLPTGNAPGSWTIIFNATDTAYTGTMAITNAVRSGDTIPTPGNWTVLTLASLVGTNTGGANDNIEFYQQFTMPAGIVPGDLVELMCEISVGSTCAGFAGCTANLGMSDGVTSYFSTFGSASTTAATAVQSTAYTIVLKTPRILVAPIASGTRTFNAGINLYFDTTTATGTATGVFKVGNVSIRKVNL